MERTLRGKFKKLISLLMVSVMLLSALFVIASCGRRDKYPGALKIGSTEVPKTLMPYVSTASVNTFTAGLLYDTLLGSQSEPAEFDGEDYYFEDGEKFEPINQTENYFKFTDGLVETAGAYERKNGSEYGWITFTPTLEQYEEQLERKKIVKGRDEIGNPITETDGQFEQRAEEAVPKDNWREYRFKVREGYTWSDGEKFTAADIDFTFKYALRYSGALASIAYFLNNYYSSEAVNDNTFTLVLASNKLSDIKTICSSILIIPEHIWGSISKPAENKNTNPVGTGAYKVASGDYIEDSSLVLTYREDYDENLKQEKFAYEPIKKLAIIKIANQDVMLNALQAGDIDVSLDGIEESKAYAIQGNNRYNKVSISSYSSPFVTTLAFNVGKYGAFRDSNFNGNGHKIRQAISYAIDQERLITNVRHSNASKVGGGLVLDWMPHSLRDESGNYIDHEKNIEKAEQLLNEAGYTVGSSGKRNLSFSILAASGSEPLVREIGNMINDALGISIGFVLADAQYSEVIKQSNGANFDMILNSVSFDTEQLLMFDARFGIYPNGAPRVFNYTGIISSELSALMRQMDTETDITEQYKKAQEVQKKLIELCVEAPLYSAKSYSAFSTQNFKGWIELKRGGVLNAYSFRYLQKK